MNWTPLVVLVGLLATTIRFFRCESLVVPTSLSLGKPVSQSRSKIAIGRPIYADTLIIKTLVRLDFPS